MLMWAEYEEVEDEKKGRRLGFVIGMCLVLSSRDIAAAAIGEVSVRFMKTPEFSEFHAYQLMSH